MTIKSVVLANGQELVAHVVAVDENFVQLTDPLVLQQMIDQKTGRPIVGFAEWPAMARRGQTIRVPITGLLAMPALVLEEVERSYISNTTGLSLPAEPKILLS